MRRRQFLALLGTALGSTTAGATPSTTTTTSAPTSEAPTFPESVGDHSMFGVDPGRTGHDPDERGPSAPVQSRWCVGSGASNRLTSIAAVDGVVFVGSPATGLRAFDPSTGDIQWTTGFKGYPDSPTVAGGRVFTTDGHAVYALGVESGRELWSTAPGNVTTTSALVTDADDDGRTLLVAGEEEDESGAHTGSYITSLDPEDGSVHWRNAVEQNTLYGSLAARDGVVYGGGSTHYFHAFDVETGQRRWRTELGDHVTSPAVGPESVFVGNDQGTVHALDPSDGTERWTYETGAKVRTSPAVADRTVYVAATNGILSALDARTGERRWQFDGGRRLTVPPTVVGRGEDAVVYVGSAQGNLFAVDSADGSLQWSHQLPDAVETEPVVLDGIVLAGDNEGRVHALVSEAMSTPGNGGCHVSTPTSTPSNANEDADLDGIPDGRDYAPRDASVQRRVDVGAKTKNEEWGFLSGVGVGAVVSAFGAGVSWWFGARSD